MRYLLFAAVVVYAGTAGWFAIGVDVRRNRAMLWRVQMLARIRSDIDDLSRVLGESLSPSMERLAESVTAMSTSFQQLGRTFGKTAASLHALGAAVDTRVVVVEPDGNVL